MHDLIQMLLVQAQAAWRWRWFGLLAAWLVTCVSFLIVQFVPDRYVSSARVQIDTDSMLRPLMRGIAAEVNTDLLTRLSLVRRTLLSRPNLEQVMRMTDLDIEATSVVEMEEILASLRARLTVEREGQEENLFLVKFIDTDPRLARDVVQALLTIFVETNLGVNREDIARTQRFLDGQIQEIERQLEEAETNLARYRIENQSLLPGEGNAQGELASAKKELEDIEIRQIEEIRVRDELKRELARFAASTPGYEPPTSPQAARVAELERELQLLLTKFTEDHPDVIALRRLLKHERTVLETANEVESVVTTEPVEVPTTRSQLLRIQLAEHNTRIAEMDRRAARLKAQILDLQQSVARIPLIHAEYAQLEREYEVIKENQVALLERREAARFAEEIDTKSDSVQFRIVEPPNLPVSARGPDRTMLRAGGLVGGLTTGVGLAILMSLAIPTFGTAQEIEEYLRRPVIGRITVSPSPMDRWRDRANSTAFIIALAGLIGLSALIVAGVPQQVSELISRLLSQLAALPF